MIDVKKLQEMLLKEIKATETEKPLKDSVRKMCIRDS